MIVPLSPDDAARFCDVCRAANYDATHLVDLLGISIPPPPHHPQADAFAALADAATPFHRLVTLFFLGRPVDSERTSAMLPSGFLDLCVECGLLQRQHDVLAPLALVVPFEDWLLAADLLQSDSRNDQHRVPTLSQPAMHLLSFSIRQSARTTLDLCGGCGLHGIVASRFSDQVLSSDLNPQAKAFVEFNCALNGCENLEALTGDMFAPVQGRKFDLILSNPPFVISPSERATFRDNAFELDGFLEDMLLNVPEYLEEGGFFQATCEWVQVRGQDWRDRFRAWLRCSGCDAWVVEANRLLPNSYAKNRLREMTADPLQLATGLESWNRYYHDREVEAIYGGLVFLRRREGANWLDVTQLSQSVSEPIGEAVLQGFASRDLLFSADGDQALLDCRLQVATGLRQEEVSQWQDGGWQPESITLRIEDGLPVTIGVDKHLRDLIGLFDGTRTTEPVLDEFAKNLGMPADAAQTQSLQVVRQFIHSGILVPVP
jgi:16S rRNA G966 N2-methylase RsmD